MLAEMWRMCWEYESLACYLPDTSELTAQLFSRYNKTQAACHEVFGPLTHFIFKSFTGYLFPTCAHLVRKNTMSGFHWWIQVCLVLCSISITMAAQTPVYFLSAFLLFVPMYITHWSKRKGNKYFAFSYDDYELLVNVKATTDDIWAKFILWKNVYSLAHSTDISLLK